MRGYAPIPAHLYARQGVGYQLIGAGMLFLAGGGNSKPSDYAELERWTRVRYERGMRSRKGER
jgi:hypothetical protein